VCRKKLSDMFSESYVTYQYLPHLEMVLPPVHSSHSRIKINDNGVEQRFDDSLSP